ncbi:MAG: hypothetical protein H7Y60_04460 [Rhodospirillaceae bacterium]|nr:hypothetical protein [Rhodospirillales bacterium]
MTTILANYNSAELQAALDSAKITMETLFNPVDFSALGGMDFSGTPLSLTSTKLVLGGSQTGVYAVFSGSGLGYNLSSNTPTGTITSLDLYQDGVYSGSPGYTVTGTPVAKLTLSGSQLQMKLYDPAGSGTVLSTMTITGTLPTSAAGAAALFGFNVDGVEISGSGTFAMTSLNYTDSKGNIFDLGSTGLTVTVPASVTGAHGYKLVLAGNFATTLTAANIKTILDGSLTPLSQSVTSVKFFDTTTDAALASPLTSITGLPAGVTLGMLLQDLQYSNFSNLFTSQDVFNASGVTDGITMNLGNPLDSTAQFAVSTIIGGSGADTLTGGTGSETIMGGAGNDVLSGQNAGGISLTGKVLWGDSGINELGNITAMSDDGKYVFFTSPDSRLASGTLGIGNTAEGTNTGTWNLYKYDTTNGTATKMNVTPVTGGAAYSGTQGVSPYYGDKFSINADGSIVAFTVGGWGLYYNSAGTVRYIGGSDHNGVRVVGNDIFYGTGGHVLRYSTTTEITTLLANGSYSAVSADGTKIAVYDGYSTVNVFSGADTATSVIVGSTDYSISLGGDYRLYGFSNDGKYLLSGNASGSTIRLWNLTTGTELLGGIQVSNWARTSLSADGRYVIYQTAQDDPRGGYLVYQYDTTNGQQTLISAAANGGTDGTIWGTAISASGQYVGMIGSANLLGVSADNVSEVLVYDRNAAEPGETSVDTLIGGAGADTLTGGNGKTVYMYNGVAEAGDTITNFESGTDKISLSGGAVWGLGSNLQVYSSVQPGLTTAYLYFSANQLHYVDALDVDTIIATTTGATVSTGDVITSQNIYAPTGSAIINMTAQPMVDVVRAAVAGTTFITGTSNLSSTGTVVGSAGTDTLQYTDTQVDLSGLTLSSVEVIKGPANGASSFTLSQGNLATGGSVLGNADSNTIVAAGSSLNLSNTTLSSIEVIKAGLTTATTFTVDQLDLATNGSVVGSDSIDTLIVNGTTVNLGATTLSSVEIIKAATAGATTFTLAQSALGANSSVIGTAGADIISAAGSSLDLSTTTLSSIETVKAGLTTATTFTLSQGNLTSGVVSVLGTGGSDTLVASDTSLNLGTTTLTSIEVLKAGNVGDTTFTVNQADLNSNIVSVVGNTGTDTLVTADTTITLANVSLSSVEVLKAGSTSATTFTVDQADLATGGSVVGNAGTDTLVVTGTSLNLGGTTLSSVEIIKAGNGAITTFTVDQGDLATGGSIIGSGAVDTLVVNDAMVDLSATTLTSVEVIKAGAGAATSFTLAQSDLVASGSIIGTTGLDTIVTGGTSLNLSTTTLSGIEALRVGTTGATTLTVAQNNLMANGSVTGNTGTDTLVAAGTTLDLSSTNVSDVEVLKAGIAAATIFTVNQADLATNGSVVGNGGVDTLVAMDTTLDLSTTTLSSIEMLKAGNTASTIFTVAAGSKPTNGTVVGNLGTDTLVVNNTSITLTDLTLSGVEVLKAGMATATTFTVDQLDLATNGSVIGTAGTDTLIVAGATVNLGTTTLSSIEIIKAATAGATTFTLAQSALGTGSSVIGTAGVDIVVAAGSSLDLSTTTLSSIETIKAGLTTATSFTVDQSDLAANGSVIGTAGVDTLVAEGTTLTLTGTTLSSIEVLKAGNVGGTTFTVDAVDLVSGGAVTGNAGLDTLVVAGAVVDLSATTLSSVEVIKASSAANTVFTLNGADFAAGGSVVGNVGTDTIITVGGSIDLSTTILSSIEVVKAGTTATTFTVNPSSLPSSIVGTAGIDTIVADSALDLSATSLSGIEVIKSTLSSGNITVNQANLVSGGAVTGNAGTLTLTGSTIDLSKTTLSGIATVNASAVTGTSTLNGGVGGQTLTGGTGATTYIYNVAADGGDTITNFRVGTDKVLFSGTWALGGNWISNFGTAYNGMQAQPYLYATANEVHYVSATGTDTLVATTSGATLTSGDVTVRSNVAQANSGAVNLNSGSYSGFVLSGFDTSLPTDLFQAMSTTATTVTASMTALSPYSTLIGSSGADILGFTDTQVDVSRMTLTSIETLRANNALATTFTVAQGNLATNGSVVGNAGIDTLIATEASLNLANTTLTSVEVIKAGNTAATTFTVDQLDLATGGSVIGNVGVDTLAAVGNTLNLNATTLSSVEVLKANSTAATIFTVDQADLASGGSIIGNTGMDTVVAAGAALDLTGTTLSSIEMLKAGLGLASNFIVDQADLATNGSVVGNGGIDTLTVNDVSINLTATTLSGIEVLAAGIDAATVFTVDQTDLSARVIGTSGLDTLVTNGAMLDLSATVLSGVDVLQAGTAGPTTFKIDQVDLLPGGSVVGNAGADTLVAMGTTLTLASTTLSSVEVIKAGNAGATTLTLAQANLASSGSVLGNTGIDTLVLTDTSVDLTGTTLSSMEVVKAGASTATTFTVNQGNMTASLIGTGGLDTLIAASTSLNLTGTTLSSIDVLQAGAGAATVFTVAQSNLSSVASLAGISSIAGSTGLDTLVVTGTTVDLTNIALSSIEVVKASGTTATTFTMSQAGLLAGGTVVGSSGLDTLVVTGTAVDLSKTTLSSLEVIKTASASPTSITVVQADLATGGTIIGNTGVDTLIAAGANLDLTATTLTSVEVLKAGARAATTFLVDQADLAISGSVIGSAGRDTLVAVGGILDLSKTAVSGVEVLKAGTATATAFTVDQADLATGGTVIGARNSDTLIVSGTSLDLTNTTLSSVEVIKAGTAAATTFTVDQADLATSGSVIGTGAVDTLVVKDAMVDLGGTTLSSVEVIKAGANAATNFSLTQAALVATGGSVIGTAGLDTIVAAGTSLNLSATTLSGIEVLRVGTTGNTVLTVAQSNLMANGSVTGNTGTDTLVITGASLDLTSTIVSDIEVLKAGTAAATTFTVNQADLATNGSVVGNVGIDTLVVAGTSVDLSATTLSSVEIIKAGAGATTFTLTQDDLAAVGGSVIGSSGWDTIAAAATTLDLSATTLSGIEVIRAANVGDTTLAVAQANLFVGGAVTGNTGTDTLLSKAASLDLTGTTLSGIEVLKAGLTVATTFTVDQADLAVAASVVGNAGVDTLVVSGTSVNLGAVTLSGIEVLKAATIGATTFSVDQGDLAANGSVIGNSGIDTLAILGTGLNLTATTLTSVEVIKTANAASTTITVDQLDLAMGGSVLGNAGTDTLVAAGTSLNLNTTTLSGIEVIAAGSTSATSFTVDQADLASGGSVEGNAGTDTLIAAGASLDLTGTTLSSLEVIKAGNGAATTFTVDLADLASGGSVVGTGAVDTLVVKDATVNLTATTLSSVEVIKAGTTGDTTFTVDQSDLTIGGSVIGNAGTDALVISSTALNLTGTTMSGIEVIKAGAATATTFTVDQTDLATGGSVVGTVENDTLVVTGATVNLGAVTLSSVEVLKAATAGATLFTVDQTDLASGGSVVGSAGIDTFAILGTSLNLTATTLSSIEVIKAANTSGTTFTVDQPDLVAGGSVVGNIGTDTLTIAGTTLNLTAITLSGVEVIKAGNAADTIITLDQTDLFLNGSVVGNSGVDTLVVTGTAIDLSKTTLSDMEVIKAGATTATTFTLTQADLYSNGSVLGTAGIDTIVAAGSGLDLSATTLSSIEIVKTMSTTGASLFGSVGAETLMGGTGADTLNGGDGTDTLIGGGGNDTYAFNAGNFGTDTVVNTGATGLLDLSATTASLQSISRSGTGNVNATLSFTSGNAITAANQFAAIGTAGAGAVGSVKLANGVTYTMLAGLTDTGNGNSILVGTSGADTLTVSGAGDDLLFGGDGNDTYVVGNNSFGTVTVQDGAGTDSLDVGYVSTPLAFVSRSNGGSDLTLSYGAGKTVAVTNQFNGQAVETLLTPYQSYTIQAGLTATSGNNLIVGLNGTANIISAVGSTGTNLLFGGDDADTITGGGGDDFLDGGTGANTLIGGGGNDTFSTANALAGTTNLLTGGAGNDTFLLGGAGTTTIDASAGGADTYTLSDSFGAVTINNSLRSSGSVVNIDNQITSDPVSFTRSGNDLVIGFSDGTSTLTIANQYDGAGHGIASITGHGQTLTIESTGLTGGTDSAIIVSDDSDSIITGSTAGGDMLFGGAGNDTITGSTAGGEMMSGGAGTDTMTAYGAHNALAGGADADTLTGGTGVTVFHYNDASEGGDTITNFKAGDKITVVSANFSGLTAGTLAASNFVSASGATAATAAATFLYDTASHTLSFDADGTGAGTAVTIATFSNNAAITSNDLLVVNKTLG